MRGIDYMHSKGIFHRDIKPENILIKDKTIKIADFGSCRGIHSKQPYTEYIATRWYRAPECLLCDGIYGYKMDIWAAGCVFYEIITKSPLFPGKNELDQIDKIHAILGTPSPRILKRLLGSKGLLPEYRFPPKDGSGLRALMPSVSDNCMELLHLLLIYDPDPRVSSKDVMKHAFFADYTSEASTVNGTMTKHSENHSSKHSSVIRAPKQDPKQHGEDSNSKVLQISQQIGQIKKEHSMKEESITMTKLISPRNSIGDSKSNESITRKPSKLEDTKDRKYGSNRSLRDLRLRADILPKKNYTYNVKRPDDQSSKVVVGMRRRTTKIESKNSVTVTLPSIQIDKKPIGRDLKYSKTAKDTDYKKIPGQLILPSISTGK